MTKPITNVCHSIRTRLLNVAKREGTFFQTILTRYFHERLLYRIANSQFCSQFYLKGGALMYALNSIAARPTLDLDLLGVNIDNSHSNIIDAFKAICECDYCDDGVAFGSQPPPFARSFFASASSSCRRLFIRLRANPF